MKKISLKLLAILLTVAMLCSMLPAFASAADVVKKNDSQEISKKSEAIIEADIWDKIDAFEDDNIIETRDNPVDTTDYAALSDEIEALVKQSETYVEGSIVRNGAFFTWETTEGIVCGYSPELRYRTRNVAETGNDNTTVMEFGTKAAPSDKDVFLIAPYYGYDSSFTNQYKNEASSIASATGGKYTLYEGTNATITNIANAFQNGGVVIFDSHGTTDYDNGNGNYTARANTSYLCLKTSSGVTSSDMAAVSGTYGTYYHAFNGGSAYCVDGTAIKNHMTKAAPGTILWMAICLGMATAGIQSPMRAAGCEVVYGYSQSVTFTGDYKYETYFWNKMKAGSDVATAVSYMKSAAGCNWDPAYAGYSQSQAKAQYAAFPIVVSDQDTYPGQGKVDAVQTVYSTYKLIDSGSGSTTPTNPTTSTNPDTGETYTYNLVTSASNLTAGEYILINVADGNYYALSTTQDGSYAVMQSIQVGLSSVASAITCSTSDAPSFEFTLSGNANGFTLKNSNGGLYAYSGDDGVGLYYDTASTWTGSYNSSSKGFTLKSGSLYMSLRNDVSTTGENGYPIFAVSDSTSTGSTLMHMYKREGSGGSTTPCTHPTTTTSTTPATCTTPGSTVVTCNSCGAVVSTTEIPATGHNITYTSNNDGTHALYCSNCGGTGSAECTYTNNVCNYCGYVNNDGNTTVDSYTYSLVTSASDLTSGDYILIVVGADGNYYALSTTKDGSYATMQSIQVGLTSVASKISCDSASAVSFEYDLSGNANGFTLSNGYGSLYGYSGSDGVGLYYDTASTWTGSYNSTSKGFNLKTGSLYMALRDDITTMGENGTPMFAVSSSTSTGSALFHMYKKDGTNTEEPCTHANTTTTTTDATCTAAGKTVVTCDDCGETVSTTTIPALGHDYKYTSNNNGTHKITCSRCTYSSSANCTLVSNKCSYCGYTYVEPTEPSEPEVPEDIEIEEGQYVIAAKVDGVYYAMANTFASKINGAQITVKNGKVAAADAAPYAVNLTAVDGAWTIESLDGSFLKYASGTNLGKSTTAYTWTVTAGTNGSFRFESTTAGRGLVFRASTYNQFGGYALSNVTATSTEYYDIELLPIDGEISTEPEVCTHENTTTTTTAATCTAAGKTVETCDDCGEVIKTTTIPALGHDYKYTSNNNGTHKVTCSRCDYTATEDCVLNNNNTCPDCGYVYEEPELPEIPEDPEVELEEGQYVIAAKVDGKYYAMSNTFASKVNGAEITVTNGKVAAADAEGYIVTLTATDGAWVIEGANGYLKYASGTNLGTSTTEYTWNITAGTNGTWRVASTASNTRGLVYRAKTYNQFGGYALSNVTATGTEYYDIELLPVDGEIGGGEVESFNVKISHSLNLASDISINYAVATSALSGYSNYYLEVVVPVYEGNTKTGTETVTIQPVLNGNYYYFTMDGINATQMNNTLEATLYASKDGKTYASAVDSYSIATYAYNQLNANLNEALVKLCAELLRYGAKSQTYKAYRTNALADANMTAAHKANLVALDDVVFGNTNTTANDLTNPTVTWVGKSLLLDSKVTLRMIVNLSNYTGNLSNLNVRVTYTNLEGETVTATVNEYTVYNEANKQYAFDFDGLRAAEIRTVLSCAVYNGNTRVSTTLQYSMDTYGNNKTGNLLAVCQALVAYGDAAAAFFK